MNMLLQQTRPLGGQPSAPLEWPFQTTEELLGLEVVHCQVQRHQDFSHFAKWDDMLLAITRSGRCIVVGYLAHPAAVDLPFWEE